MNERHLVYAMVGLLSLALCVPAQAGVVVFTDIDEFRAAAGPLVEIDFNTLPDGSPSPLHEIVDITPEFNYTNLGVTFSSPGPLLYVFRSIDGASLAASTDSSGHTWLEAEFDPHVFAVGVTIPGGNNLTVFDIQRELLGEVSGGGFLGLISDVSIDLAILDRNTAGVVITSILIQPVPEPATLFLLSAGILLFARRRGRCSAVGGKRRLAHCAAAGVAMLAFGPSSQAGVVVFTDIDEFRGAARKLPRFSDE